MFKTQVEEVRLSRAWGPLGKRILRKLQRVHAGQISQRRPGGFAKNTSQLGNVFLGIA